MILVTGGAGFIGSNIVAHLDEQNVATIVSDRLRSENKWRNLAQRRLQNFVFPENLDQFLAQEGHQVTAIIHMGAISATTAIDADEVMRNNFQLSVKLWDWCTANAVKFIYASSAATYGDGANGFSDIYHSTHLATLKPLNLYGWSKHLFDRWVAEKVENNLPTPPQWVGLKFFNVYGPNEYHKGGMRSVISQLHDTLIAGGHPRLFKSYKEQYPDGGQLRDFVYIKDCVKFIEWLLQNPHVSGIYNVGTGAARSFADLAKATMHAMAIFDREIEFIEMPESMREKYQYFTQAEHQNLKNIGYDQAFYSLEDGISDYVQQYLLAANQYR